MAPVVFLVSLIIFALVRLTPGDPVQVMLGEEPDPATIAAVRKELGLDQPLPVQYVRWAGRLAEGDFGRSLRTRQPVREAIVERLPATLELGLAALAISIALALVVGTISAVRRNSAADLVATSFTLIGVSLPNFFLGIVLILVVAYYLRWVPPGGYTPWVEDPGRNLKQLILPAITLATASTAVNMRIVRSSLLDVLAQDFIRVAWAKGLPERLVLLRHALRNAMIPVATVIGIQVGGILEGALITETIFSWPGVGRLAVESIAGRDYPVVQAVVLLGALSYLLANLAVDVLYVYLDPRISYGGRR